MSVISCVMLYIHFCYALDGGIAANMSSINS